MKHATLCFLIEGNPPQKILLGLKKRGFGRDKYNGFGGKIETGETITSALIRELREEARIEISEAALEPMAQLTFRFPTQPDWDHFVHVFVTRVWNGIPIETDEMKPTWFAVEDIPYQTMWDDDAYWLPRVLEEEKLKATFIYQADLETVDEVNFKPWIEDAGV